MDGGTVTVRFSVLEHFTFLSSCILYSPCCHCLLRLLFSLCFLWLWLCLLFVLCLCFCAAARPSAKRASDNQPTSQNASFFHFRKQQRYKDPSPSSPIPDPSSTLLFHSHFTPAHLSLILSPPSQSPQGTALALLPPGPTSDTERGSAALRRFRASPVPHCPPCALCLVSPPSYPP